MKTTHRLTGLTLAVLLTLTMLGGVDQLAQGGFAAATATQALAALPAAPGAAPG